MKRLLGSTGLLTAGLTMGGALIPLGTAAAEEPIKLTVGGYFKSAYMVVFDDDDEFEPGNDRNTDGFFSDAEIHFTGSTVLDNGLEVGARVELEGETDGPEEGDQIDEAWIWFSGGFGELRIGSEDEALANACIVPPGGTTNFSAFSPNQWGANSNASNTVCTGIDALSDAQKIVYVSPVFHGLQLTASYTPDQFAETHNDGGGPHLGMTSKSVTEADYTTSVYLTYSYEGEDWGLTWGGGASFENGAGAFHAGIVTSKPEERDFYQTGLNVRLGNFSIGGAFEYMNDISGVEVKIGSDGFRQSADAWIAGGGLSYTHDAWTFGAQYSYRKDELFDKIYSTGDETKENRVQQRAVATVNYALGPGIAIDAELGYTWVDFDPDEDRLLIGGVDDYDALEIGIGSSFTF